MHKRNHDQNVLVVELCEFGRTPKISPLGLHQEHLAYVGSASFFGGGLRAKSSAKLIRSINSQISFQNITSTIYRAVGIDLGFDDRS